MVEHVVLIGFGPTTTTEQVDKVILELVNLKNKIPGIVSLQAGRNIAASQSDYSVVLTGRFENNAAFDAYGPHPEHQRVVAYMKEVGLNKIAVGDFQID